jgi:hypothetical protein
MLFQRDLVDHLLTPQRHCEEPTQAGPARLAHFSKTISGKPEIGGRRSNLGEIASLRSQ